MMRTVHLYDAKTGLFTGGSFSSDHVYGFDEALRLNTPNGVAALETAGPIDYPSQRIAVEKLGPEEAATAAHVVDYQPPAPSADHEWNAAAKRWRLNAAVQAAHEAQQAALAQIAFLEESQPRAVREALLGLPGGLERLRDIDGQIAALRPGLAP